MGTKKERKRRIDRETEKPHATPHRSDCRLGWGLGVNTVSAPHLANPTIKLRCYSGRGGGFYPQSNINKCRQLILLHSHTLLASLVICMQVNCDMTQLYVIL